MSNKYSELKQKQQKEVNEFPMMFAFSNKQFKEGMEKLGLTETDTRKIYSVGGGGYIRRTDSKAYNEMFTRFEQELKDAIENDETGDGFIYEMFMYELGNHEYAYTGEIEPTLDALGLTYEDIQSNEKLKISLNKACKDQLNNSN